MVAEDALRDYTCSRAGGDCVSSPIVAKNRLLGKIDRGKSDESDQDSHQELNILIHSAAPAVSPDQPDPPMLPDP